MEKLWGLGPRDFFQNLKDFRYNLQGFPSKSLRILVIIIKDLGLNFKGLLVRILKDFVQTPKCILVKILQYFVKILENNGQHLKGF